MLFFFGRSTKIRIYVKIIHLTYYSYLCLGLSNIFLMLKELLLSALIFCAATISAQTKADKIEVSDDLEILKLSDNIYLHRSFLETQKWGKVGANGLILIKDNQALLIDTPWNNEQTEELNKWIESSLHATIKTVIPTHWHEDRMGGLTYLQSKGVKSYANQQTIELTKAKHLPIPDTGFKDSLNVNFQGIDLKLYYPGGGHTTDNIIVWIPSEDILFGGCFVKDLQSSNLGNLADADVEAWPASMKWVLNKFPNVKTVVPGHGNIGGCNLLTYTLELLSKENTDK